MAANGTAKPPRIPKYRLHKPSGRAVVTLLGRDVYLGEYGSPESRAEYDRVIGEWLAKGRAIAVAGDEVTVNELILAYCRHAESYYAKPDGSEGRESEIIKLALRPARKLYGRTAAKDFGPTALKACRQEFVKRDLARGVINQHTNRIRRMFRWAVENELLPAEVHGALAAVPGIKRGRAGVRESEKIRPVPQELLDAVLPRVSSQVAAMIRLQLFTGMRPGEVVQMRPCDIDRSEKVWTYTPAHHKTEHHGHERVVLLGPRAQKVLGPFLDRAPEAPLFSPKEAEAARNAKRRLERVTPMTPSHAKRKPKRKPEKAPRDAYDVTSYRKAIAQTCAALEIPNWHPHQLRHNAATEIRKEFGAEMARIILGHRHLKVTEIYAENREGAARHAPPGGGAARVRPGRRRAASRDGPSRGLPQGEAGRARGRNRPELMIARASGHRQRLRGERVHQARGQGEVPRARSLLIALVTTFFRVRVDARPPSPMIDPRASPEPPENARS